MHYLLCILLRNLISESRNSLNKEDAFRYIFIPIQKTILNFMAEPRGFTTDLKSTELETTVITMDAVLQ
jgi:hypothetical protein